MKQRICLGHQYAYEKIQPLTSLDMDLVPRQEAIELTTELINNAYDLYEVESMEGELDEDNSGLIQEN